MINFAVETLLALKMFGVDCGGDKEFVVELSLVPKMLEWVILVKNFAAETILMLKLA